MARMRWGALVIELVAILVASEMLGAELPLGPMGALVAVGAISNAWLGSRKDRAGHLGGFLLLDVALLSGLLHLSGGPTNPFSIFYVVYIAMSAVMLSPRWTWAIAALSVVSFASLFFARAPDAHLGHGAHGQGFEAHLYGMFVAFVLAVALITYFVSQMSQELRRRERALAEAEERAHRWGKLASIATLAAGAAHQLGTPLSTIAVAAKEIERRASNVEGAEGLVQDAELIRQELGRCRAVLDGMSAAGGQHVGEAVRSVKVDALLAEVRAKLGQELAERWQTRSAVEDIEVPKEALVQMIENIARNGFDACEQGSVSLDICSRDGAVEMVFADEGNGMNEETRSRATDPFFTTKNAEDRMGLGLFLARSLVDSLGGELAIDSALGRGTTIRVTIPARS